ncbi:hypothetical protein ACEUAI_12960 [Aeromonas veronii]|uniref:hypothetical protein n=1 Tax=Aeromonas hydrophila TaxID=644 RepID=UPI002B48B824|nr:hypothetical protein [Aeromonas hydrophila]
MSEFLVKLTGARSPSGVAYIGPLKTDGFKTESPTEAFKFTRTEAHLYHQLWLSQYQGKPGFKPSQLEVIPAS